MNTQNQTEEAAESGGISGLSFKHGPREPLETTLRLRGPWKCRSGIKERFKVHSEEGLRERRENEEEGEKNLGQEREGVRTNAEFKVNQETVTCAARMGGGQHDED